MKKLWRKRAREVGKEALGFSPPTPEQRAKQFESIGRRWSVSGAAGDTSAPFGVEPVPAKSHLIFGASLEDLTQRGHYSRGLPLCIKQMLGYIEQHGLAEPRLWATSGVRNKVQELRTRYDAMLDVDLSQYSVHDVASTVKAFLRDLPEPILCNSNYSRLIDLFAEHENEPNDGLDSPALLAELASVLASIPPLNRRLLRALVRHLKLVEQQSAANGMGSKHLAISFGPTLLWPPLERLSKLGVESKYINLMNQCLLDQYNRLFGDLNVEESVAVMDPAVTAAAAAAAAATARSSSTCTSSSTSGSNAERGNCSIDSDIDQALDRVLARSAVGASDASGASDDGTEDHAIGRRSCPQQYGTMHSRSRSVEATLRLSDAQQPRMSVLIDAATLSPLVPNTSSAPQRRPTAEAAAVASASPIRQPLASPTLRINVDDSINAEAAAAAATAAGNSSSGINATASSVRPSPIRMPLPLPLPSSPPEPSNPVAPSMVVVPPRSLSRLLNGAPASASASSLPRNMLREASNATLDDLSWNVSAISGSTDTLRGLDSNASAASILALSDVTDDWIGDRPRSNSTTSRGRLLVPPLNLPVREISTADMSVYHSARDTVHAASARSSDSQRSTTEYTSTSYTARSRHDHAVSAEQKQQQQQQNDEATSHVYSSDTSASDAERNDDGDDEASGSMQPGHSSPARLCKASSESSLSSNAAEDRRLSLMQASRFLSRVHSSSELPSDHAHHPQQQRGHRNHDSVMPLGDMVLEIASTKQESDTEVLRCKYEALCVESVRLSNENRDLRITMQRMRDEEGVRVRELSKAIEHVTQQKDALEHKHAALRQEYASMRTWTEQRLSGAMVELKQEAQAHADTRRRLERLRRRHELQQKRLAASESGAVQRGSAVRATDNDSRAVTTTSRHSRARSFIPTRLARTSTHASAAESSVVAQAGNAVDLAACDAIASSDGAVGSVSAERENELRSEIREQLDLVYACQYRMQVDVYEKHIASLEAQLEFRTGQVRDLTQRLNITVADLPRFAAANSTTAVAAASPCTDGSAAAPGAHYPLAASVANRLLTPLPSIPATPRSVSASQADAAMIPVAATAAPAGRVAAEPGKSVLQRYRKMLQLFLLIGGIVAVMVYAHRSEHEAVGSSSGPAHGVDPIALRYM